MELEFNGIDELIQQFEETVNNVDEIKSEALEAAGIILQEEVKRRSPKLTENLFKHVELSDVKNDEIEVFVDNQGKAYYGYMLEVGTSKMRAQPFMFPAFQLMRNRMQAKMIEVIRKRMGLV